VTIQVTLLLFYQIDKEEQKLLHDNLVFDAHLDERSPLNIKFMGYKMIQAQ